MGIPDNIVYRTMADGEEDEVFNLVKAGFDEYVRPDVTEDGAKEFFRAAREMIYDRPMGHIILIAESEGVIAGMICIRNSRHICLLFVSGEFRKKGIGRGLIERAIVKCSADNPGSSALKVNSSLYAVPIYKKFGFREVTAEQSVNGIRFVPMIKPLK